MSKCFHITYSFPFGLFELRSGANSDLVDHAARVDAIEHERRDKWSVLAHNELASFLSSNSTKNRRDIMNMASSIAQNLL